MRTRDQEEFQRKKIMLMEKCYDCYAENGLGSEMCIRDRVYTHPKYIRYGKQFFEGVNRRYTEYAKSLEPKLGIPYTTITPLIFILIQTCVHYAMFEDEYYLQSQLEALKQAIRLLMTQYRTEDARPDVKAES